MGSVGGERRESGRSYNRAPGVSWGGSVCLHHIRVNIRDVSLNSQSSLSAGFLFVSKYKKKKKKTLKSIGLRGRFQECAERPKKLSRPTHAFPGEVERGEPRSAGSVQLSDCKQGSLSRSGWCHVFHIFLLFVRDV